MSTIRYCFLHESAVAIVTRHQCYSIQTLEEYQWKFLSLVVVRGHKEHQCFFLPFIFLPLSFFCLLLHSHSLARARAPTSFLHISFIFLETVSSILEQIMITSCITRFFAARFHFILVHIFTKWI
jgi:hypothetical protein